jgi:hypothetical protein
MTQYCDFTELPISSCMHCNLPAVAPLRPQVLGEKADSGHARAVFRARVLEARPNAVVRDNGSADEVTVDGTKVWVKTTLEPEASKTSFQFHDGAKMLTVCVEYIALVNTALGDIHMIRKADADGEARLQLQASTAGRITLKPSATRVQRHLRALEDVFLA